VVEETFSADGLVNGVCNGMFLESRHEDQYTFYASSPVSGCHNSILGRCQRPSYLSCTNNDIIYYFQVNPNIQLLYHHSSWSRNCRTSLAGSFLEKCIASSCPWFTKIETMESKQLSSLMKVIYLSVYTIRPTKYQKSNEGHDCEIYRMTGFLCRRNASKFKH
jgi:hypothetical protein